MLEKSEVSIHNFKKINILVYKMPNSEKNVRHNMPGPKVML